MRVLPLPTRSLASLSFASFQLGHLGTNYLDGASLASVWQTVISTFLFDAIGGCVNTLCSQAYGAKNFKLVGIWLHIGMLVGTIACVPVGALYFVTEPVLRAFGFVANTDLAASFSRWSVIGLWPSVMYTLINNYYQVRCATMDLILLTPRLTTTAVIMMLCAPCRVKASCSRA